MRKIVLGATLAMLAAGAAAAQPVGVREAEKMLFSPKGFSVSIRQDLGLSAVDARTLEVLVGMDQFMASAAYYGAIAFAPGDGLVSEATFLASNLHNPEAAADAALKGCNAKKKSAAPCVVAADVLPKNWTRQALSLNAGATADLRTYKRGRGPKAMAISPSTGVYSITKGPNADRAAMNDCLARVQPMGAQDCAVVIADN